VSLAPSLKRTFRVPGKEKGSAGERSEIIGPERKSAKNDNEEKLDRNAHFVRGQRGNDQCVGGIGGRGSRLEIARSHLLGKDSGKGFLYSRRKVHPTRGPRDAREGAKEGGTCSCEMKE